VSKVIHLIAAARPNFMKIAPLYHALSEEKWCEARIVHTGQHYDPSMSDAFFRDLRMPKPDFHLEVGSGTHAQQTGGVMIAYERVCFEYPPDLIVVVGDVNSTAACAIVGAKLHIPVVHLEAGLRSRDRRMPEEINRLVTDAIADVFWTPSEDADENLRSEGVPAEKIECIGNVMIDSYEMLRPLIEQAAATERFGVSPGGYLVATLHRPSNVDHIESLSELVSELVAISRKTKIVFAIHPRTRKRLEEFSLLERLQKESGMVLTGPLGYIEFMSLISSARAVITDSGGVQEETTYLGIPCMTLRDNTERPVTVTMGTNRLVKPCDLQQYVARALDGTWPQSKVPPRWDGRAAVRAVEDLRRRMDAGLF
jgi:UDP-N-acetylglucosamine 2-epimerase